MRNKKEGIKINPEFEELKNSRKFYLKEYIKDKRNFKEKRLKKNDYLILSKANKIRYYFISYRDYFPFLIEEAKKERESYNKGLEFSLKNIVGYSLSRIRGFKKLIDESNKKIEIYNRMIEDHRRKFNLIMVNKKFEKFEKT